jgi:hypothetical protein
MGLHIDPAIRLTAELARAEALATAGPPCILHPIMRAAVSASLTNDKASCGHWSWARGLDRDRGALGPVAARLTRVQPAGDAGRGVPRLAARSAMDTGAPGQAGVLLRRAASRPPYGALITDYARLGTVRAC